MTLQSNPCHLSPASAPADRADAEGALRLIGQPPPWDDGMQRCRVEVDLAALRRNAVAIAERSRARLLPMVKADAYGLGAVAVARALEPLDPWGYGVASVVEGQALRIAGIERPIVVFTPFLPGDLGRARVARLTPTLHEAADIATWASFGEAPWHLAIDTGMNRAGVSWDAVDAICDAVAALPPEGAFTHFHSADVDAAATAEQERRFVAALDRLPVRPAVLHAENSPAVERRGPSPWNVVRPGIFLYGVDIGGAIEAAPVVHLRARVVDLRIVRDGDTVSYGATWRARGNRLIATVACGYADGYRRHLSGRGEGLLAGRRVSVAGVVTMDMTMFDVSGVPCAIGDTVTLLGHDGADVLTVGEVAAMGQLSPYELLTGLGLRASHHYLNADDVTPTDARSAA